MFVMQENGEIADQVTIHGDDHPVGTRMYFRQVSHSQVGRHTGWKYTARVYSVNRETGEYSNDWIGYNLDQRTVTRVYCDGRTSGAAPAPITAERMAMAAPMTGDDERDEIVESTTEAPESTTEASDSSTPESSVTTTPEETTSTEPTTTPESSTTEPTPSPTEDPKPVLVETVPNGAVTAGWTQGYTRVVVVDRDGAELAGGRVEEGSTLHWVNDELWILGPTENFRIMRGTDGDWRFYTDGGDVPRELRGN